LYDYILTKCIDSCDRLKFENPIFGLFQYE